MKITWFGAATILIETNNNRILFDPFAGLYGCENHNDIGKFLDEENIFITHGHFDHLYNVKDILKKGKGTVYCTKTPYKTLKKQRADINKIIVIEPLDIFKIGNIKIKVLKAKHNKLDMLLFFKRLFSFRSLKFLSNIFFMAENNAVYQEGRETAAFLIEAENKKVLVLGSMGLDKKVSYTKNIDVLILPYQGRLDNLKPASQIVKIIKPKTVVLNHFDDAFPPLTKSVDTEPFFDKMNVQYSDIKIIKPEFEKIIEV